MYVKLLSIDALFKLVIATFYYFNIQGNALLQF